MKQCDMNERLNISRTTWSNYEQGKTTPTLDCLVKISQLFSVTLDELISQDMEEKFNQRRHKPYPTYNHDNNQWLMKEDSMEYVFQKINNLEFEVHQLKHPQEPKQAGFTPYPDPEKKDSKDA